MNLKQLKAKGGVVDATLVKKEVIWAHVDPKTGKPVTDKFTVHVRRQSFGVIERLFAYIFSIVPISDDSLPVHPCR